MTPGVEALAVAAPIATPVVAGLAAWAAFRTFNLRSRIDYAEEWWKRAQYALELSLGDNQHGQLLGITMLDNLIGEEHGKKLLRRKPYERDLSMIRQAVADLLFLGSGETDSFKEADGVMMVVAQRKRMNRDDPGGESRSLSGESNPSDGFSSRGSARLSQLIQQRRAALIVKIDEQLGQSTPSQIKDMAKKKSA